MDQELLRLRAQNKAWEYISLALNRSSSTCADRYNTVLDPNLKHWTPQMTARLDQMVEEGMSWKYIANALDSKVITCQHQWRTLVYSGASMNVFWEAWIAHNGSNWQTVMKDFGEKRNSKSPLELKQMIMSSVISAPGWAKLEIFNFISQAIREAKERAINALETSNGEDINEGPKGWSPAEHGALLKAVEEYGLFSGWTKIRKVVKPDLTDEEVEAEYYRLNGVEDEGPTDSLEQEEEENEEVKEKARQKSEIIGDWTEDEIAKLKLIMMKYSTLPAWVQEAAKHGVKASDSDYETLFNRVTKSTTSTKKSSTKTSKKASKKKSKKASAKASSDSQDESSASPSDDNHHAVASQTEEEEVEKKEESKVPLWNTDNTKRLRRLVSQQQHRFYNSGLPIDWSWVAEHIGPGYTAHMCISAWQAMPESSHMEPSRVWDDEDILLLEKGIQKHGRSWVGIQKEFMPERTTDSIRRKVSNLISSRNRLIREQRRVAQRVKQTDPDLDVETFVKEALNKVPTFRISERMLQLEAFKLTDLEKSKMEDF
ncbi:hypothetical protein BGZ94_005608 [Podila epigama]|nr:hypothetical protein BGZ94_005608 [Podila epigama]